MGEDGLGEFARKQIEAARRDPRLDRNDGRAMIADFNDALEEAERVRSLGRWGLRELSRTLEREEQEIGRTNDDPALEAGQRRRLQAAWERQEWAKAELAAGSPHSNAQSLISMVSALDAMVEDLVKTWREVLVRGMARDVYETGLASVPQDAAEQVPEGLLETVRAVVHKQVDEMVPKAKRPRGVGASRYEVPLRRVGWAAPVDRPLPVTLDEALCELGALRDVLVHRAGRVDAKALKEASTLRYAQGDFVRVTDDEYRKYSAAIRCYGREIQFRGIRSWPEVDDARDGPDLSRWEDYYMLGA